MLPINNQLKRGNLKTMRKLFGPIHGNKVHNFGLNRQYSKKKQFTKTDPRIYIKSKQISIEEIKLSN